MLHISAIFISTRDKGMIKARMRRPCFLAAVFILSTSSNLVASPDGTVNKTLVWPDGTQYVGEAREGKRWAKGTIFWSDGTRFVGTFANDLRNGPGTMILPDSTIYNGYFADNDLVDAPSNSTASTSNEIVAVAENSAIKETLVAEDVSVIKGIIEMTSIPKLEAQTNSESELAFKNEKPLSVPLNLDVSELTDRVKVDLKSMIDLRAAAWSDKNVVQYLAYYSDEFKVPGKQNRRQWEALRQTRLKRPKSINVSLVFEKVEITSLNIASVEFMQYYESNIFSDRTRKQFILKKEGESWKTLSEQSI
ncbi:MAG: hypothetical protein ACI9CE_002998 [Flavobacterium sp.]